LNNKKLIAFGTKPIERDREGERVREREYKYNESIKMSYPKRCGLFNVQISLLIQIYM
jgi:hypothetical protein